MTRHSVYRGKCMNSCWVRMGPDIPLNAHGPSLVEPVSSVRQGAFYAAISILEAMWMHRLTISRPRISRADQATGIGS
jgi:hypothetical protein